MNTMILVSVVGDFLLLLVLLNTANQMSNVRKFWEEKLNAISRAGQMTVESVDKVFDWCRNHRGSK